jgi:hypothetical protein
MLTWLHANTYPEYAPPRFSGVSSTQLGTLAWLLHPIIQQGLCVKRLGQTPEEREDATSPLTIDVSFHGRAQRVKRRSSAEQATHPPRRLLQGGCSETHSVPGQYTFQFRSCRNISNWSFRHTTLEPQRILRFGFCSGLPYAYDAGRLTSDIQFVSIYILKCVERVHYLSSCCSPRRKAYFPNMIIRISKAPRMGRVDRSSTRDPTSHPLSK